MSLKKKSKLHPLKEGIVKEIEKRTLQDCLDCLCNEKSENPLPCREDQIAFVSNFISQALEESENQTPKILYITGNPGTGKTATIKHCIKTALYPNKILYENCKSETPKIFTRKNDLPKIRILDEIETLSNLKDILTNALSLNVSVIGLSNSHDSAFLIKKYYSNFELLVYDSYDYSQIVTILRERTGESNQNDNNLRVISENAFIMLAKRVEKERGDVRAAIHTLRHILTEAISRNAEKIDLSLCHSILEQTASSSVRKNPVSELPLPAKLALFSISKDSSNWISLWRRSSEKVRSDISSGPNEQLTILQDHDIIGPLRGKTPPKIRGSITNDMIFEALGEEIIALIN